MNKTNIKICGIKDKNILDCCIANHVSYFGLVFYEKSPRYIDYDAALELIAYAKDKPIIPVGVVYNKPIDELKKIIKKTSLTHIQLHGNEDDKYMQSLKKEFNIKIIKSVGVNHLNDIYIIKKINAPDYYLFDYKPKDGELPGGNAKKFDWSILKKLSTHKSWFISGGININNILGILDNLKPYGIDISSGVEEKKGIKDCNKIKNITRKINE